MTQLLETPTPSIVDVLRGERGRRPRPDVTAAGGLRAQLEDGLFGIVGAERPDRSLTVTAATRRRSATVSYLESSPLGRLRGALVGELARLLCVGASLTRPYDDAVQAWRSHATGELVLALENLDRDDVARLATDVDAHFATLRTALGDAPRRFQPRSAVRTVQSLAGGSVVLRDVIDLMFGSTATSFTTVTLLDLTTAPLGTDVESLVGYHALSQTLRSSTVPLRSAVYSTATDELYARDVDVAMLQRSLDELLDVIDREWNQR